MQLQHTGLSASTEIALFIKHAVIGQQLLVVTGAALAIHQQRGAVEQHAGLIATARVTEHQRHARPLRAGLGQLLHRCVAGINKCRAQIQVFGCVAAQRQLGRQQQASPPGMGLAGRSHDFFNITR